jgi:5'-3' exonuclease
MGIKYLNNYLLRHVSIQCIYKLNISECKNKTIVIDTSIYIYEYVKNNELENSFIKMINIFKDYNIKPIFVFDGKPPKEKYDLLNKRKVIKQRAEQKYNLLKTQPLTPISELEYLKSQMTRITHHDINKVKDILLLNNIQIIQADKEADIVCANMVINNEAWACLTNDMDMFIYGCPRTIRLLDLNNQTIIFYDLYKILLELNINMNSFREILVLSGSDYNIQSKTNLYKTLKWYRKYQKYLYDNDTIRNINYQQTYTFYEWLNKNTKYIDNYTKLVKTNSMYIL